MHPIGPDGGVGRHNGVLRPAEAQAGKGLRRATRIGRWAVCGTGAASAFLRAPDVVSGGDLFEPLLPRWRRSWSILDRIRRAVGALVSFLDEQPVLRFLFSRLRRAPARNPPFRRSPWSSKLQLTLFPSPSCGSPFGVQVPRSHSITSPPPYSPFGGPFEGAILPADGPRRGRRGVFPPGRDSARASPPSFSGRHRAQAEIESEKAARPMLSGMT